MQFKILFFFCSRVQRSVCVCLMNRTPFWFPQRRKVHAFHADESKRQIKPSAHLSVLSLSLLLCLSIFSAISHNYSKTQTQINFRFTQQKSPQKSLEDLSTHSSFVKSNKHLHISTSQEQSPCKATSVFINRTPSVTIQTNTCFSSHCYQSIITNNNCFNSDITTLSEKY